MLGSHRLYITNMGESVETIFTYGRAYKALDAGLFRINHHKPKFPDPMGEWNGMLGEYTLEQTFGIVIETKNGGCATLDRQTFQQRRRTHTDAWLFESKTTTETTGRLYIGLSDKIWSIAILSLVLNPYRVAQFKTLPQAIYDRKPIRTFMLGWLLVGNIRNNYLPDSEHKWIVPQKDLRPIRELQPFVTFLNKVRIQSSKIDMVQYDEDKSFLNNFGCYPPVCPILPNTPASWIYSTKYGV